MVSQDNFKNRNPLLAGRTIYDPILLGKPKEKGYENLYHNFKNLARRVIANARFGDKAQEALWVEDSFCAYLPIWDRYKIHKEQMRNLANYLKNIAHKNFEKAKKTGHILFVCSPIFPGFNLKNLKNFPTRKWAESSPNNSCCSLESCS